MEKVDSITHYFMLKVKQIQNLNKFGIEKFTLVSCLTLFSHDVKSKHLKQATVVYTALRKFTFFTMFLND